MQNMCELDSLLDAMLNFDLWPKTLRSLADRFEADHGFVYFISPDGTEAFASEGSEALFDIIIANRWHERNSRANRGIELLRSGRSGLLTDWNSFTPEEIEAEPFEQELAQKYNTQRFAACVFPIETETYMMISFERSLRKGQYRDHTLKQVSEFLILADRVIRFGMSIQRRMAVALVNSVARPGRYGALIDPGGRILHVSEGFFAALSPFAAIGEGGVGATIKGGQFDELLNMGAQGVAADSEVTLVDLGGSGQTGTARTIPVHAISSRRHVLLTIDLKPRTKANLTQHHRQRFALTLAEVQLAMRLYEGLSLREAAQAERISYESARTRLKVIFGKVDVSRQAELVSKIAVLPVQ